MSRQVKTYGSRANEQLEDLIAKFKPRFGNDRDIRIATEYGAIKKLLSEVNSSEMRQLELKKLEGQMTKKMKDIRMKERNLISTIMKRNAEL